MIYICQKIRVYFYKWPWEKKGFLQENENSLAHMPSVLTIVYNFWLIAWNVSPTQHYIPDSPDLKFLNNSVIKMYLERIIIENVWCSRIFQLTFIPTWPFLVPWSPIVAYPFRRCVLLVPQTKTDELYESPRTSLCIW